MFIAFLRNVRRRLAVLACLVLLMLMLLVQVSPAMAIGNKLVITYYNNAAHTTAIGWYIDETGCGGGIYSYGTTSPYRTIAFPPC